MENKLWKRPLLHKQPDTIHELAITLNKETINTKNIGMDLNCY